MKFNNITKKVCLGAAALLAAISFNSCTDKNDWEVDPSYDRLFHTTSLSVTPFDDRAAVEFKLMANTAKYIVEVSKDTLNNDVVENADGNSIIQELTSTPDTIYGLDGSTKYFIRMRGVSEDGKSSNWKYLDKYSFKTKSEQIITNVVPSSTSAEVSFIAGKQVDAAYIYKDGDSVKQDISAAEVAAGLITLTGLKANSSYKVKLWNGDIVRGTYNFKTTEAFPEGYQVITLAEGDDLNDILANAENDKVVIVFPQGMDYKTPLDADGKNKVPTIPANIKSIYFWGAAGENMPTFMPLGIKFDGTNADRDIIRFYNLKLKNKGKSDNYVLNISGANNINSIEIEKCEIALTRGVVRFQNISSECKVGKISIKNCVIGNIGSYGVVNTKNQTQMSLGELNISNTTIANVEAGALVNVHQAGMKINVDHCTIYNCVQTGKPMFDVNKLTDITLDMNACLIGPFYNHDDTTIKGVSMKDQQSVTSTYYTNDLIWNSGYELGDQLSGSSTELWEDPANGNFTIKSAFKSQCESLGDPRWIVAE